MIDIGRGQKFVIFDVKRDRCEKKIPIFTLNILLTLNKNIYIIKNVEYIL